MTDHLPNAAHFADPQKVARDIVLDSVVTIVRLMAL
jgi:hypothetical protein